MIAIFCPEKISTKIFACLCALAIGFGAMTLIYQKGEEQKKHWNNGICECGGTYELSAVLQNIYEKYFYYTCDTCKRTEKFTSLMK